MTSMFLNPQTSATSIGDLLASATSPVIEIKDEAGKLLATVFVNTNTEAAKSVVEQAEFDIEDLRRRRSADRARDITTLELLTRAASSSKE